MSLRRFAPLVALLAACHKAPAVSVDPSPKSLDPVRLTEVLAEQFTRSADAWNRGDLDAFVGDYAADSATTFMDGRRPQHGLAWIRAHYAPLFQPGAKRDSLRFEEFTARPLGTTWALVTARYILYRNGATTASGPFTLVMEERPEGWRILHDHSSSDPR